MSSQVNVITSNEIVDREPDLLGTEPINECYMHQTASNAPESLNLSAPTVASVQGETEEGNYACDGPNIWEELVNSCDYPETIPRYNAVNRDVRPPLDTLQTDPNRFTDHALQTGSRVPENSKMTLRGSRDLQNLSQNGRIRSLGTQTSGMNQSTDVPSGQFIPFYYPDGMHYYYPTYTYGPIPQFPPLTSGAPMHRGYYPYPVSHDNMKNGPNYCGFSKVSNYGPASVRLPNTSEPSNTRNIGSAHATSSNNKIYQRRTHHSKPKYQQKQPTINYAPKTNEAQPHPKCTCKKFYKPSKQMHHRSSTANVKQIQTSNRTLPSVTNHQPETGRVPVGSMIAGPSHNNRPKQNLVKCRGCGRYTTRKHRNVRKNTHSYGCVNQHHHQHHHHANDHSSGFRRTYYTK